MPDRKELAESIAYCGLVCCLCHEAGTCGGCRSDTNCCGRRLRAQGCFQYNCCIEKGLRGCWECAEAPCGKDMFGADHDIRNRVFVKVAREEGLESLAAYVLRNQAAGIRYGWQQDYDGLGSEAAVIDLLHKGADSVYAPGKPTAGSIRPAVPEDRKAIYRLLCDLEETEVDIEQFSNAYKANMTSPSVFYFVFEKDDKIQGFISLHIQKLLHHASNIAEIQELIVDGDARRMGIGKYLFDRAKEASRESGCTQLEVCCNHSRFASHRFYEAQGMETRHYKFCLQL